MDLLIAHDSQMSYALHSTVRRTGLLLAAVASLMLAFAPASARVLDEVPDEPLSLADAVNKAGRQRMLAERILKAYCLVGLGARPERAELQLHTAVDLFDWQLIELAVLTGNHPKLTSLVDAVQNQWNEYREIAAADVSLDGVKRLVAINRPLVNASDKLVRVLGSMTASPHDRLVSMAGRQRMLSQRIAKLYMLRDVGLDTEAVRDAIAAAGTEFDANHAALVSAPENNAPITRDLATAAEQWTWLKSALRYPDIERHGGDAEFFPLIVQDASEKTLHLMDRVTMRYQRLSQTAAGLSD